MPAKTGKFPVPCTYCGETIERYPYQLKARDHHFCDKGCFAAYLKTLVGPDAPCYKAITVQCAVCGKEFQRAPRRVIKVANVFCSRRCSHIHKAASSVTVACDACGKPLTRQRYQVRKFKHFFCDFQCEGDWLAGNIVGSKNRNWRGGAATHYGRNWKRQKEAARKRDGYSCQACGVHHASKSLDVHHIIPFKSFGYIPGENNNYLQANRLDNLVSLCRTCHNMIEAGRLELWRPNR